MAAADEGTERVVDVGVHFLSTPKWIECLGVVSVDPTPVSFNPVDFTVTVDPGKGFSVLRKDGGNDGHWHTPLQLRARVKGLAFANGKLEYKLPGGFVQPDPVNFPYLVIKGANPLPQKLFEDDTFTIKIMSTEATPVRQFEVTFSDSEVVGQTDKAPNSIRCRGPFSVRIQLEEDWGGNLRYLFYLNGYLIKQQLFTDDPSTPKDKDNYVLTPERSAMPATLVLEKGPNSKVDISEIFVSSGLKPAEEKKQKAAEAKQEGAPEDAKWYSDFTVVSESGIGAHETLNWDVHDASIRPVPPIPEVARNLWTESGWWKPNVAPPNWVIFSHSSGKAMYVNSIAFRVEDDAVHTPSKVSFLFATDPEGPFTNVTSFNPKVNKDVQEFVLSEPLLAKYFMLLVDETLGGGPPWLSAAKLFGRLTSDEPFTVIPEGSWFAADHKWAIAWSGGRPDSNWGGGENLFLLDKLWDPMTCGKHWVVLDFGRKQIITQIKVNYWGWSRFAIKQIRLQSAPTRHGPFSTEAVAFCSTFALDHNDRSVSREFPLQRKVVSRFVRFCVDSTHRGLQPLVNSLEVFGIFNWKCRDHEVLAHDAFINYRVATDANLALNLTLFLGRKNPKLRVFLDQLCLNEGEDWEEGFLYGLNNSSWIILLISEAGVARIADADKRQDNVLLEYEMALHLYEQGKAKLLPMLVDNPDHSPFNFSRLPRWPDAPHACKRSSRNVKATMNALFQLQGIRISPNNFFHSASRVLELIS